MAYNYETTYQNVINCSSMDWKTLRNFSGLVRSAACARIIRQSQTINFLHYFHCKDVDHTVKGAMRTLVKGSLAVSTLVRSVTRVQRCVRTEWNVDLPTSKSIHQWDRTLKETRTLVFQISKYP
ncbi:hypothetical protein TNCV_1202211 [Trichonephila clavipes]|nr:hypothetical protein TNCV_1202211 [Trichonephila clavipes]